MTFTNHSAIVSAMTWNGYKEKEALPPVWQTKLSLAFKRYWWLIFAIAYVLFFFVWPIAQPTIVDPFFTSSRI
jgi:hypothetical protein